ncbi:bifunctional copper resistance protein CopD/cytochrome c oxidase assembly protein [Leucobacter sp. UCMA 4100]|uniref:cytochrome c oxidase assembly protein n=1 Tax=Leucobacter sp. UCMA 4100 TaxID=2810534 RepID=UPI0022EB6113|nr:cytochrome c oxidase assembly protein [Leucobacter sp. UCMA 4100]MDA3146801.1 bifunctional copper resistance protein CopD/cytochrome c oxidase assembly protein [Leucobacter sp. UCMA 4100]
MPRSLRVFAPATLIIVSVIACFVGMQVGGAGAPRPMLDPGDVVRYAVPLARMLVNLSGGVLIGSLLLAVWALKGEGAELRAVLDLAAGAAATLTAASTAAFVFMYLDMTGQDFSFDESFGASLAQFATEIDLGKLWVLMMLLGAISTVMCFAVQDRRWVLAAFVVSVLTLFPLAQQGHAQGAAGHAQAVNTLFIHMLGAAVWIGGLVALIVVSRVVDRQRIQVITERYSFLALFAFVAVALSGIVSAMLRIGTMEDLFGTGYGMVVMLKTGAIVALGIFGAVHRLIMIPKIGASDRGRRAFGQVVVVELAVMGIASGLAAALGRTQTPVPIEAASESGGAIGPAEWLTGDPLPPELTPMGYITGWKFDLLWTLVPVFGAVLYLAGVWVLRKRGDKWPVGRTISWLLGLAVLFYTTNGALNLYERYLFSVHMLGHMMLTMLIPLLLVLAGPVTLLLRAVPKRHDGSWGAREWVMWAIHTPWSKFITNPVVAAVIFAGSLWVFYFSPILGWAMREHLGHQWMIIHFLISGYLFALAMVGIDPVPYRSSYPIRLVILFATMASHAFFGVTIMSMNTMMLPEWFGAMGRTWGLPPLEDQSQGGSIAWGIGELPTLALAVAVAILWMRDDDRVQKRKDRAADRSGEAELLAYNEMLQKQAARDEKITRP